jgi:HCOMODA/2-hydroxy-3-carboxy-muconic semialdehyde decarboxylase
MDKVVRARQDLVIANRVLALQQVVDAYGHVSIRNPADHERFFLSRSLSPELVELDDLIEFRLDGTAIGDERPPYIERFIHGAIYEARPDVNVVIHAHAEATLPFGITGVPLRAVIHSARGIGTEIPVWDIAERFGDETNLLVTNTDQGRDLASRLGDNNVVLMRGHGFASAGQSIVQAVGTAINLPKNARVLLEAMRLGEVKPLARGEIVSDRRTDYDSAPSRRGWHYWATKAGCAHLL